MGSFNQELIERAITYFKTKGVILTPEQAVEHLNALADLYESFIEFAKIP